MKFIAIAAFLAGITSAIKLESDPICNSAGCTQFLHPKTDDFKKNYFVPDFGVDKEILQNHNSLKIAEAQLHHEWDFPTGKYSKKGVVKYKMDTPLDEDVLTTKKNLKETEKTLGHEWKITEVFKN